ncbi:hypothetical protein ACER0C_001798 [Sarotherodon galilaeus]
MEIRALCIRLLMTIMIHLGVQDEKVAGPVILESPAAPVLIEETVTLSCRSKIPSSNFKADFYKDGFFTHRSSTGSMTIQRVSKSDEGLYKCSISGAGESPKSWLTVTDSQNLNYTINPDKEGSHSSSAATPWIIATILVSALLVAVGLYHFGKGYWKREAGTVEAGRATYSAVRKTREAGPSRAMSSAGPCQPTAVDPFYSVIQLKRENCLKI